MSRDENHRRKRMERAKRPAGRQRWSVLLIANFLPITIALVVAVGYYQGRITFVPEASRVWPSLIVLGIGLAVLAGISWVLIPALLPAVRAVRVFVDRQAVRLLRDGILAFPARAVLLAAGIAAYGVLWANVVIVAVLLAADVIAVMMALGVFVIEALRARG